MVFVVADVAIDTTRIHSCGRCYIRSRIRTMMTLLLDGQDGVVVNRFRGRYSCWRMIQTPMKLFVVDNGVIVVPVAIDSKYK